MQTTALICLIVYTALLFLVMFITSRKADNNAYFTGSRRSPWFVVAYGMIGASLSGVTLLSVPGDVYTTQFTYYGIVIGYFIGYAIIAWVLLPLYYKLNLTSIYTYLNQRFGNNSYKVGSLFFIISRLLGSALRMYLVIFVLQEFIFSYFHIPIVVTASVFIIIILLYTFRGGIKTIVWTDTLQTTFFLLALILTIVFILKDAQMNFGDMWAAMRESGYTKMFNTDWRANNHFVKQILSGIFITITMTGLDQDMMQKNLSCKNLKDAQKNMFTFSSILMIANLLFLTLGGMLCVYATQKGIDLSGMKTDSIYPMVSMNYLPPVAGIVFIIGLIAAGYSSADGTLTALTTAICFDFLGIDNQGKTEKEKTRLRRAIHLIISAIFLIVILVFSIFHNDALIRIIFKVASYTYGPLLGLYTFGLFTKRQLKYEKLVPLIAVLSPLICLFLNILANKGYLWGYQFGFELLVLNGLITFIGLLLLGDKRA